MGFHTWAVNAGLQTLENPDLQTQRFGMQKQAAKGKSLTTLQTSRAEQGKDWATRSKGEAHNAQAWDKCDIDIQLDRNSSRLC